MFEEVDSVIFDGTIIERANGDDGELGAGFLFKCGAKSFQPLAGAGGDYAGKIGDVPDRGDFLDVVRERGSERKQKQKSIDGKPQQAGTVCKGQNRFRISASLRICRWATDKHRGF